MQHELATVDFAVDERALVESPIGQDVVQYDPGALETSDDDMSLERAASLLDDDERLPAKSDQDAPLVVQIDGAVVPLDALVEGYVEGKSVV